MIKYTKEQKQFLIDNNYMKSAEELAKMFKKRFNIDITAQKIKSFRGNHKLNSGLTGRYQKGNTPKNKGKKWDEYLSKEKQERCMTTTYKKGNKPLNYREIGSERINVDGYVEIKVGEPNKWDLKHRVVYEEHYGEIPEGYTVIFLDGNKQNLDISNLKLISRKELLVMNRKRLFTSDRDITDVGSLIAKVLVKGYDLKHERYK